MSSSSKKKLRKEQNAAALTEKQLKEVKEAKKLKIYTASFLVVLALIVGVALGFGITQGVNNSGVFQKNTMAVTIGGHELNNAELNYYYIDAVNSFYNNLTSSYGESYASTLAMVYYGLDLSEPLDEQTFDKDKGTSWADYFTESAINAAKSALGLYDKAIASGHKLTADEEKSITSQISNLELFAAYYGYKSTDKYLKAMYGPGSDAKSFEQYLRVSALADSYYNAHAEELKEQYGEKDFREFEKGKYNNYTSYTFAYYYVSADKFLPKKDTPVSGGSTSATTGTVTYTDEERAQALVDAKAAADKLVADKPVNADKFDALIKAMSINKDNKNAASTKQESVFYGSVNSLFQAWVSHATRKAGDMTIIENTTTTKDADGKEVKKVNGYYVLFFEEAEENLMKLPTVRHILFKFEHEDSKNTSSTYTDAEKKKAKEEAQKIYDEWKNGKANEESFIELAKKHSDDSTKSEGGLIEDIFPGYTVENFDAWIFDEKREPGNVEMVETEYGWHIIYYVEASEMTYRDFLIESDMVSEAMEKWSKEIVDAINATEHNTKYLERDLVMLNG